MDKVSEKIIVFYLQDGGRMFVSKTCIHLQAFTLMGIRKAKFQNVHKVMRNQQKLYRNSMQFCVSSYLAVGQKNER
jgi:hypothetical protein